MGWTIRQCAFLCTLLCVKVAQSKIVDLTDETFQHLTQAGKGSTTGNWFVLFCNTEGATCGEFLPTWEAVDEKLTEDNPGGVVLGRVSTKSNFNTCKRFRIPPDQNAHLVLIKGNFLTYYSGEKSVDKIKEFADSLGKSAQKWASVPPPLSPLEAILERVVSEAKEVYEEKQPFFWGVLLFGVFLGFLISELVKDLKGDLKKEARKKQAAQKKKGSKEE